MCVGYSGVERFKPYSIFESPLRSFFVLGLTVAFGSVLSILFLSKNATSQCPEPGKSGDDKIELNNEFVFESKLDKSASQE
jgi:hypothetical protein